MNSQSARRAAGKLSGRAPRTVVAFAAAAAPATSLAQPPAGRLTVRTADSSFLPAFIGSVDDERARIDDLARPAPADGWTLRTASERLARRRPRNVLVRPLLPSVRILHNSDVAYTENEGNLWGGRGANVRVRAGALVVHRGFALVVAPELSYSQNLPFEVPDAGVPWRSPYSSPFHRSGPYGGAEADLPIRFGDRAFSTLDLGQTALVIHAGRVDLGFTSEAEWWGPGRFTSLLWSGASPSVPRVFVRTPGRVRTRVGLIDARLVAGTLTKSRFFDHETSTRYRSMAGIGVAIEPSGTRGLSLGVSRLVVRTADGPEVGLVRFADALGYWESAPSVDTASSYRGDLIDTRTRADQLLVLSARQQLPAAGAELYGEWSRQYLPRTLREFLVAPHESQAYLLGLQWTSRPSGARRYGTPAGTRVRLGAEVNNLAQTTVFPGRATRDYYTGSGTRLGMTQRGRVLGAFTGPGSSGQWLDAGIVAPRWDVGGIAARIRWEDDALYRQSAANFQRHDVSLLAGLRATLRRTQGDVRALVTYQTRYNYLFQNGVANPGNRRTVDVQNLTVGLELAPR